MGKAALAGVGLIALLAGARLWHQTAWGSREVTFEIGTFDRED